MTDERVPPQNLLAEQSVLGSLLLDPSQGPRVFPTLRPADFYREAHQRIYACMKRHYDAGLPFDLASVAYGLRETGQLEAVGGEVYLANSLHDQVPSGANGWYFAGIVRRLARRRDWIRLAGRMIEAAHTSDEAAEQVGTEALAVMTEPIGGEAPAIPAKVRLDELVGEHMSRDTEREVLGISTGFPTLDRMTNGLRPGQMWVVAARPSVGKTAFCLSIVQHVARRRPVLFLSLEQTVDEVWNRLLGMVSGMATRHITNDVLDEVERTNLYEAFEIIDRWPLTLEYVPGMTAPLLQQRVRQAVKEGAAELVVVDHLGLLDKGGKAARYDRMTQISNTIKETAGECQVPILSLIQLSRAGERTSDRRPSLDLLRDTGAHEENAHVVIGLYRQAYYDAEKPPPTEEQEAEMIVLKAREGETGMRPIRFCPDRTFFCETTMGGRYAY